MAIKCTPLILNYASTPTKWSSVEFSEKFSNLRPRSGQQVKPTSLRGTEFCLIALNMKVAGDRGCSGIGGSIPIF
ncbi:unnamed protein product [Clavelina lepadiformis]|uniref:Uncharacterized protein n=1 Tax=Clavelina lepadiformis TaxID=159417 RepID=A0ABP0FCN7_CLALP